jgi:hypothetical protein
MIMAVAGFILGLVVVGAGAFLLYMAIGAFGGYSTLGLIMGGSVFFAGIGVCCKAVYDAMQ